MKLRPKYRLVEHFVEIDDPRIERTKRHKLIDILTIAILAVICGAEGWVAMESFGKAKHQWLKKILELPNGIPSQDTAIPNSKLDSSENLTPRGLYNS